HVTLLLAARVRDPHATNWKLWVVSGGFAMGIGIWSMHFVATLALKLPIRVLYDLPLTALSWVFAIVACSAAFIILRRLTGEHRGAVDRVPPRQPARGVHELRGRAGDGRGRGRHALHGGGGGEIRYQFGVPRRRADSRRGVDGLHHRRVHVRHPDRDDAPFGV